MARGLDDPDRHPYMGTGICDAVVLNRCPISGVFALAAVLLSWPMTGRYPARGQAEASDAALRDRVVQLLERLERPTRPRRDAAMAALTKLGPKVLPILPDAATPCPPDRKDRIEKLRAALRKAMQDEINPAASRVTIEGKGIRLTEALQQLQKQTGNAITDMREQLGMT